MKKIILIGLLMFVLYLGLGAVFPFISQPEITEETRKAVSEMDFSGAGVNLSETDESGRERAQVLADNGKALEERIRLISQAKDRIILSTFEFRTDESGKDVLAALQAAAKRGVSVQILADGMAATIRMTGNEYFYALSAMENVQIRIYNPITLLQPWKLMGRMHDKYLIADDTAYILGGRNNYDYFLGDHDGYKNYDWDVLVYHPGEGQGGSMKQLLSYFDQVWNLPLCKIFHDDSRELEKKKVMQAGKELEDRYEAMKQERPSWFEPCDYIEQTRPVNQIELVTNPTHCYAKEPVVFYAITELMGQAEKEVRFHTPYIICNDWMLERLEEVCQKVPEVKLMTNSVANNGNPFGAMDYEKYKGKILDTGVGILEYDGGVSYHGKCFVIDDRLSGIGSFNWDMRSVYLDTEMMLIIDSPEVNADLRREMGQYEADALTVIDETSYELPEGTEPQKISLKKRVRIEVLRLLAGWARFLM